MPVRSVDSEQVGEARRAGNTRIKDMYWKLHEDPAYSTPVRYELASRSWATCCDCAANFNRVGPCRGCPVLNRAMEPPCAKGLLPGHPTS